MRARRRGARGWRRRLAGGLLAVLPALGVQAPLAGASQAAPALAAMPWTRAALPFTATPALNAERGFAVACDGNRVAVGERFGGPSGAGAVHVFFWNGELWSEEATLTAGGHDRRRGDQFGSAVALRGGILAVGAPGEERDGQRPAGVVYVFDLIRTEFGPRWFKQGRVIGSSDTGERQVGRAVAVDGGLLAVAYTVGSAGGETGLVSIVALPIITGARGQLLLRADPEPGDRFGESLAFASGFLIVGAPGHRGRAGQPSAGAAYVFAPASGPSQVVKLQAADEAADAQFGSAVAVSLPNVVVGAPGPTAAASSARLGGAPAASGGAPSGAVYVFSHGSSFWPQVAKLAPAPRGASERFGHAVAIEGEVLAVGAPLRSTARGGTASGATYVFQRFNSRWVNLPEAAGSGATAYALFGFAVAQSGGAIVVGAPLAGGRSGAAYAFRLPSIPFTGAPAPPPGRQP